MKDKRTGTILIVDDQATWRELLSNILENDGHKTETAGNFEEAKNLLQTKSYDMAITDMRLVDASVYNIDGIKVLKEAKKQHPSIKTIILTGYPDEEHKNKALSYGANVYYEKIPDGKFFDTDKFSQIIFDLLKS